MRKLTEKIQDILKKAKIIERNYQYQLKIQKYVADDGLDVWEIWYCSFWGEEKKFLGDVLDNESLAEAAGNMWLYLEKEGLI